MSLTPGTRLGVYQITSQIGEGGMGQVYRARDTKLNRDVALKVLPDLFASDTERLARFTREAQTLASLNHPNIAHIHGLEESGGVRALVMELVEGEDLSQRIARGAIPLDEALAIAKQIAEALEAAHEQGIVHRDLKPANVKVRPDGTVKVLDFGLAKAMEPVGGGAPNVSQSPTITTPAMTQAGMIMGTAAYMSPEQAKGRPADKRSDAWAFGCVLYEMLAGKRAFGGDDVTDTLAAVLRSEPDWGALPPHLPSSVRRLLRRCLDKDRRRRLADIADAQLDLNDAEMGDAVLAAPLPQRRWGRSAAVAAVAMVAALIGGAGTWSFTRARGERTTPSVVRLDVALPSDQRLVASVNDDDVAISRDGTRLAYLAQKPSEPRRIYVRELSRGTSTSLAGTEEARNLFFSPDGLWVGFVAERLTLLKKIRVDGGAPIEICQCGGGPRGASWGDDDMILFSRGAGGSGLERVPAAGGSPVSVATPDRSVDQVAYAWPDLLPDGRHVLFTIVSAGARMSLAVRDLTTGVQKTIVQDGTHGRYVSTGHIVYAAGGQLLAIPFDLKALTASGNPIPMSDSPVVKATGNAAFDISRTGTLAYLAGPMATRPRQLVWVDRTGRDEAVPAPARTYLYPRISPDGQQVAIDVRDQENDIWIWDFVRKTLTRFTFDPGPNGYPAWSRDGRSLVFSLSGSLFRRPSDGSGTVERLTTAPSEQQAYTFTADGTAVLIRMSGGVGLVSIRDGRSTLLLPNGLNAELSPDSRWVAFDAPASGRREIFVRPYPVVDQGGWQVSQGGGTRPLWARDGRELFYLAPDDTLMRVPIDAAGQFVYGAPQPLLTHVGGPPDAVGRTFDIAPDGRRFLFVRDVSDRAPKGDDLRLSVALNWTTLLKNGQ